MKSKSKFIKKSIQIMLSALVAGLILIPEKVPAISTGVPTNIIVNNDMNWMKSKIQTSGNVITIDVSKHFPYLEDSAFSISDASSSNTQVVTTSINQHFLLLTVKGAGDATITIKAVDHSNLEVSEQFNVSITRLGDATGDGVVSSADALFVSQVIKGKVSITDIQKKALDMNGDNEITKEDAMLILKASTGQSNSHSTSYEYVITFANKNDAPLAFIPISNQTTPVGKELSYQIPNQTFIDVDEGDSLSYTVTQSDGSPLPSWLTFHSDTLTFKGTPNETGTTKVKVTVSDGSNEKAETKFDIVVGRENAPPVFVGSFPEMSVATGFPNQKISIANMFVDPDGDPLILSASSNNGAIANGILIGTELTIEPKGAIGTTKIKITANDGMDTVDSYINVRAVELVPNGRLDITTKVGIPNVVIDLAKYFPGDTHFTIVEGNTLQELTGTKWTITNTNVGTRTFWAITDQHKAIYVTVKVVEQTGSNVYFSEYLDAGDGRAGLEIYYDAPTNTKAEGYSIEVYQFLSKTNQMYIWERPLLTIYAGMPFIIINSTFYDAFDVTNIPYYNDEIVLGGDNSQITVAVVLKKNGQIVDVIGTPTSDVKNFSPLLKNGGTIVRKNGNHTGSAVYDVLGEWDVYPKGTYQYFGSHTP